MPHHVEPDVAHRFREIVEPADLRRGPITPSELRLRCVVIRAAAAGDGTTIQVVRSSMPWMSLWYDHPSWRTGVWRCVVDDAVDGPRYTAYERRTLAFHTDMSRYEKPPEFTVIRCTRPDSSGGDNLVLHIDDIVDKLLGQGRHDVVEMLGRRRVLNTEERHRVPRPRHSPDDAPIRVPIANARRPGEPIRVFDRHAASKGSHLALDGGEEALLDEFVDACAASPELAVRVRLERHDTLVFSNWRMLHARLSCAGPGRVTEICMGDVPATPEGAVDAAG